MNGQPLPRVKTALTPIQRRALLTHIDGWIATGFGAGLFQKAPGTFGSLVALLPWWFLLRGLPIVWYAIVLIGALAIGIWACEVAGKRLGVDDSSALVWDEFTGQWIALCAAPLAWPWVIAGFVLFRLFDIWKPWPVRVVDRHVHGGLGVMLDDVLAGIYALIVMRIAALYLR